MLKKPKNVTKKVTKKKVSKQKSKSTSKKKVIKKRKNPETITSLQIEELSNLPKVNKKQVTQYLSQAKIYLDKVGEKYKHEALDNLLLDVYNKIKWTDETREAVKKGLLYFRKESKYKYRGAEDLDYTEYDKMMHNMMDDLPSKKRNWF